MAYKQPTAEDLNALVNQLKQAYAGDPNIRSIGWGRAKRGGKVTNEISILFFVRTKVPSARAVRALGSTPIPEEIDGVPTDVIESNPRPASAGDRDEKAYDPLVGGVATSNAEGHTYWFNGSGTLGMLVRDADDDTPMALSNWHVWADGGEEGDAIIQPGHPTAGDHIVGVGKVLACGPLLTSLIEWEAPSPLTWGLYGGAAAAAVAAALSDYRDPSLRGQDNTAPAPGDLTEQESVDVAIEYPQLPLPGRPFETQVKWTYERQTESETLTHVVEEERINTQFLLGKMIVTDRATYRPGGRVHLTAAIWDYQPRPCDAYHVTAHLIPQAHPTQVIRKVLQPKACPRTIPTTPPDGGGEAEEDCVLFNQQREGEYPYKGRFEWLAYLNPAQEPVRIVDWLDSTLALHIPHDGLQLTHAPTTRVVARVAQFTGQPVEVTVYNAAGQIVDQATAPAGQGTVHELTLEGAGIVRAEIGGGGGEGLLVAYCILREAEPDEEPCVIFADREVGEYAYKGRFEWLEYVNPAQNPVHIVDWFKGAPALLLPPNRLVFSHPPASQVRVRVAQFTGEPITVSVRNGAGQVVDEKSSSAAQGTVEELVLSGAGIVSALVRGGGGEGLVLEYCIVPERGETFRPAIGEALRASIAGELPGLALAARSLESNRCCFEGEVLLPPTASPGSWDVHLVVQNVNHVPAGTPPEEAAKVIGGHVLSAHGSPEVVGCTVLMLSDHVFDII